MSLSGLFYEVVVNHSSLLGEGPLWDAKRGSIWWVDILQGEIHEFNVLQKLHRTINVHEMVGTIVLCKNGDLIAALKSGVARIDMNNGELEWLCNPETHLLNNRFNDGKCDPAGRFWVGTMALSEAEGAGNLYMIDKNLSASLKVENLTIPNGMAWSLDWKTFYFIDTPTFEVIAYRYDNESGAISNKKTVIKVPEEDGYPDGMTIDREGMLWIAHWGGWQVTRWNPITGEKLFHIPLPVAQVTSCTFGGDDLQDLYITSAKVDLTPDQQEQQPLAGSLFVIRNCGFQGMEAFEFDTQHFNI